MQNAGALIENLKKLPNETEYIEFKRDFTEPEKKPRIFVRSRTRQRLMRFRWLARYGTSTMLPMRSLALRSNLNLAKKGNRELEIWLRQHLSANARFEFMESECCGFPVVVLKIWPAYHQSVQYDNIVYVRTGSCKPIDPDTPFRYMKYEPS